MNMHESATKSTAISDIQHSFDVVCSTQAHTTPFTYDPLEQALNYENKVLKITTKNQIHFTIFKAIVAGLTVYNTANGPKSSLAFIQGIIRPFINWINSCDGARTKIERYECLTDYDIYRRKERNLKHSRVSCIKKTISCGLDSDQLSKEEVLYLTRLNKLTKAIPQPLADGYALTKWFSLAWFRNHLEERLFLQVESPQRLVMSLRVTAAVTLLHLLKCREQWHARFPLLETAASEDVSNGRNPRYERNYWLIRNIARFDEKGKPTDDLTELLLIDIYDADALPLLLTSIKSAHEWQELPPRKKFENKSIAICKAPASFTDKYPEHYTELEELLAAWLCASQCVQPTDIAKLKTTDFAYEYNDHGRLLFMQIKYFKGRAGNIKETGLLAASDVCSQALHKYIQMLPEPGLLFRTGVCRHLAASDFTKRTAASVVNPLGSIWNLSNVNNQLNREFARSKSSPIFLKAMQTLSIPPTVFSTERGVSEQGKSYPTPPTRLFTLMHIKNSSVHSRSDRYRDSDLINHNSHTSATEKHSYLTDSNKDWVNQCGRITRIVLHDLQNVVYQPSIDKIQRDVHELILKTQIVEATGDVSESVMSLDLSAATVESDGQDHIIVSDTIDSALYFLHYIEQAEAKFDQLLKVRPDFVEKILIARIEWMTRLLTQMSHTKKATTEYQQLKKFLPPVFDHILASIE